MHSIATSLNLVLTDMPVTLAPHELTAAQRESNRHPIAFKETELADIFRPRRQLVDSSKCEAKVSTVRWMAARAF